MQEFEFRLEDNLFALNRELGSGRYRHGPYRQFRLYDPKPRLISKATVRDRLVHRAIYRKLCMLFDPTFIFESYAARNEKGTHAGFRRLVTLSRKVSRNYTRPCWALKCDIRKFFDSIDHHRLRHFLAERIADQELLELLRLTISSFSISPSKGMPLGNLTSQLFANIYLDPLDKFIKRRLRAAYYLRYADDLLLLAATPSELLGFFVELQRFVREELSLSIHPEKIQLRKLRWGIDFVGYVAYPGYQLPRHRTLKRIKRRAIEWSQSDSGRLRAAIPSYLGYLQHASGLPLFDELCYLAGIADRRRMSFCGF